MSINVKALTVSDIVQAIKRNLESNFRTLVVKGEVSNLSNSSAGHWYFTLSDKQSSISVALFKGDAYRNPFIKKMKDGDEIICVGNISVYTRRGTFQLLAKQLHSVGKGDLKEQFEQLKKKLANEGLFDLKIKKELPLFPKRVVVITALKAAALADFIHVYKRRSLSMDLLIIPSLVQGDEAPRELRAALQKALSLKSKPDVIVFTRGGGSLEDLWAFNDEGLAREIAKCPIPVLSAIGHQVDYSICDYVSDMRAETPTAAAEILTFAQTKYNEQLKNVRGRLLQSVYIIFQEKRAWLEQHRPTQIAGKIWQFFMKLSQRIEKGNIANRLEEFASLNEKAFLLDDAFSRMKNSVQNNLENLNQEVSHKGVLLAALNPSKVLERGYTYLETCNSEILMDKKSFDSLDDNDHFIIQFSDGKSKAWKNKKK